LPQVAVLACVCREERGATCYGAASTFFNPMLLFSPRSRVTPTIAAGEPAISLRGDELNMGSQNKHLKRDAVNKHAG
jgi:hypothetical protein